MVTNRLTTEFSEDTLSIVVIDTVGCFGHPLKEMLAAKGIITTTLSAAEVIQSSTNEVFEAAYKVVVCLSPAQYQSELLVVLEKLQPIQEKTYIVMPVLSGCQEFVAGEIPYFSNYIDSQKQLIIECNSTLPQATFIFAQDIILPPGKFGLFEFYCQYIQQGFIFAPNISIAPHTLPEFCAQAVLEFLRPQRISVSIKGRTKFAYSVLERLSRQYEGYYFSPVGLQRVEMREQETLPFTVKDVSLPTDEEFTTKWFSRQLPSPEMEPFFAAQNLSFYQPQLDPEEPAEAYQPMFERVPALPLYEPDAPDFWGELLTQEQNIDTVPQQKIIASQVIELDTMVHSVPSKSNQSPTPLETLSSETEKTIDEFNVSSEIQKIFSHTRFEQKTERVLNLAKTRRAITQKSRKKNILFYGGLGFIGLGIVTLLLIVVFMGSTLWFKQQILASVEQPEKIQQTNVRILQSFVNFQAKVYKKIFEVPQIDEAEKLVVVGTNLQQLQAPAAQTSEVTKKLFSLLMGKSTGDVAQLTEKLTSETLIAYEAASTVEQSLHQIVFPETEKSEKLIQSQQKMLEGLQFKTALLQQLGAKLPELVGVGQKRRYALIMQNNQELRPTGGFMDAIAIVTFENGSLVDRQVYTSYELDKKVPGDVAAPAEVTQVLGTKKFALYDANWSPDFPTSAATIQWFLEKTLNTTVDGVIMVDLYGMQRLIEATGPLELPEYNEVITNKNLLERLEFHSEVVLLETEKNHDYRKVLFSHLLEKIILLPEEKVGILLSILKENASSKAMQYAFTRPDEAQIVKNLGWSGIQFIPNCPQEFANSECFVDHFMQVEANIGVNKANYYIKRTIDHTISIENSVAKHDHVISYQNTAQVGAWPKGPYKNYLKLYLPSSTMGVSVQVDGQLVPDAQIVRTVEKEYLVIATQVEVPIKSTKQVTVSYSVPLKITNNRFSYVFFNNEQPGNGETPFLLRILPSPGLHPQVIAPQATVGADGVVFSRNNDESSLFAIEFTQAK